MEMYGEEMRKKKSNYGSEGGAGDGGERRDARAHRRRKRAAMGLLLLEIVCFEIGNDLVVATLRDSGYRSVYAVIEKPFILVQSAALVEILHSLVGIVAALVEILAQFVYEILKSPITAGDDFCRD